MNAKEYHAYQEAVQDFFDHEGIANLTTGHLRCPECSIAFDDDGKCPECGMSKDSADQPFFARSSCDCCGRQLDGDREFATGFNPATKEVHEYHICLDCAYYAEYRRLDDETMMKIEEEEAVAS